MNPGFSLPVHFSYSLLPVFLCDSFSLTRVLCVTIDSELFHRGLMEWQRAHNWMQWHPLSLHLSAENSSAVSCLCLGHVWAHSGGRSSVAIHSCWGSVIAMTVYCSNGNLPSVFWLFGPFHPIFWDVSWALEGLIPQPSLFASPSAATSLCVYWHSLASLVNAESGNCQWA